MIGIFGEKDAGILTRPALFPGVQTEMAPYVSGYLGIRYFILMRESLSIRGELVYVDEVVTGYELPCPCSSPEVIGYLYHRV